jgi:hypothetical protein
MGTEEIIEKTKDYFCYGIEEEDLAVRIDYARTLKKGDIVIDFGTGEGRYAVTMAMANPDIWVFTFDKGRSDQTDVDLAIRTHTRLKEQNVHNVIYNLGDSQDAYPRWSNKIAGLSIDSDGSYGVTKAEIERWFPFLVSGDSKIFIQSYNLINKYPGISRAVDEYCREHSEYAYEKGMYGNTKVIMKL